MKTILSTIFFISCLLFGGAAHAQTYQLVWADEFTNGISQDWVFETGTGSGGWGNNELQYYRRENATVSNGQLVITARRENYGGMQYTSARMKTQGRKSFKYGRIEARIAMPSFQGVWPAFWMLGDNITSVGWPACGEIDIMEHVNTGGNIHGNIHWSDNNGNYANYGGSTNTTITNYHVYSVEWTPAYIKWFVDGVQYHEVNIQNGVNGTSEFHNNQFLLLNMAIGGNWPGFTVDNGAFPANMYVDYVRVYQQTSTQPEFSLTRQAESYSSMSGVQVENTTDVGGGQNVGWIDAGDWMAYNSINIPTTGSYRVEYRVASPNGSQLSLDLNGGSVQLGAVNIPATGGWQNWTTVSHNVNLNAGTYNFGVYAPRGGWNFNWWRITRNTSARIAGATEATETEAAPQAALGFYPNPTSREINLSAAESFRGGEIQIFNTAGKKVFKGTFKENVLDVSGLKPGLYILKIAKDGQSTSHRFVKQ